MSENILSRAVHRIFELPMKKNPNCKDYAFLFGNAEYEMLEAISSELSYTDALRVANALHAYADRIEASVKHEDKFRCDTCGHVKGSEPCLRSHPQTL